MKKAIITMIVLGLVAGLAACGETADISPVNAQQAQQIALDQVGFTADEVADIQTHVGEYEDKDCFSVQFSIGGKDYEFVIDQTTGDILYP